MMDFGHEDTRHARQSRIWGLSLRCLKRELFWTTDILPRRGPAKVRAAKEVIWAFLESDSIRDDLRLFGAVLSILPVLQSEESGEDDRFAARIRFWNSCSSLSFGNGFDVVSVMDVSLRAESLVEDDESEMRCTVLGVAWGTRSSWGDDSGVRSWWIEILGKSCSSCLTRVIGGTVCGGASDSPVTPCVENKFRSLLLMMQYWNDMWVLQMSHKSSSSSCSDVASKVPFCSSSNFRCLNNLGSNLTSNLLMSIMLIYFNCVWTNSRKHFKLASANLRFVWFISSWVLIFFNMFSTN